MKPRKITTHLLVILIFMSMQSSAGINDAKWYISIDIQQVNNTEIYKLIPNTYGIAPKYLSHATLYGDATGIEKATAVLHGDFTGEFSSDSFIDNIQTVNGFPEWLKEKEFRYKNHTIEVAEFRKYDVFKGEYKTKQENIDPKQFYYSQISNNLFVMSFDLNEVKNWVDNKYNEIDIQKDSVISVVVDVQSAFAHMGMNIDKNNHMMQSEIFKKMVQVSASVSELNGDIVIDVALTAADEATAIQIEQVINGLVAMNNLSGANDKNKVHKILMQNLKIERNIGNILINSYAAVDEVKKMEIKKPDFDKYKVGETFIIRKTIEKK